MSVGVELLSTCGGEAGRHSPCRSRRRRPHAGRSRVGRLLLQHGPVEHVVVLVVQCAEQNTEQLSEIHVIGRLLKPQPSAVV